MVLLLVRRGCCVVVRSPTESIFLCFVIDTIQSAVFVLQYFGVDSIHEETISYQIQCVLSTVFYGSIRLVRISTYCATQAILLYVVK